MVDGDCGRPFQTYVSFVHKVNHPLHCTISSSTYILANWPTLQRGKFSAVAEIIVCSQICHCLLCTSCNVHFLAAQYSWARHLPWQCMSVRPSRAYLFVTFVRLNFTQSVSFRACKRWRTVTLQRQYLYMYMYVSTNCVRSQWQIDFVAVRSAVADRRSFDN